MSETPRGVSHKTGIKGGMSITGNASSSGVSSRSGSANGKSNGNSSSKKKKCRNRRRGENEIYKAADTSVNAHSKLEAMCFPKATFVVKMPTNKARARNHPVSQDQFADASEPMDRHLRQNRADSLGVGRPPFGYFSLHPATLLIHPPHAVHHYYPYTPSNFNSWMRSPPPFASTRVPTSAAPSQFNHAAHNMVHHSHPHSQQQNGASPKIPQRQVSQHRPGMPVMSPHQQAHMNQQRNQQQQHVQHHPSQVQGGVAPGFMEFAVRKRQENLRHQEALKMKQDQSHHQHEQLRQMKSQQQQLPHQASPREKRHLEQMQQQQESTAAVLASMRGSQPTLSQTQMKLMPRTHPGMPGEGTVAEQEAGMHLPARMALEECRKNPAAAAKFLGQFSQTKDVQMAYSYPPHMAAHHQQVHAHPHALRPPVPKYEGSHSPQPPSVKAGKPGQPQTVLAPATSEDASLDENGAGAKQFVKRMITTSEESPLTTGMEQLETLPMLMYTPPDSKKDHPVREQEITNCDVLLGRGGMTNHHVGNMHFRTLVSSFRLHYCAAKKGDKGRLSKKLTNFVRHKNGRFLQKDDVDNLWYEVGDSRAHGKCAQALREGTADLNRQVANGVQFEASVPPPPESSVQSVPSYPKAYAVRPPTAAAPPVGSLSLANATARYHPHETEMLHQGHSGIIPPAPARPVRHPPPTGGVPGDQSSPRSTTRPPADGTAKNSGRAGHSPPVAARQPPPPKRPLAKTQSNTNGQARKPAVVAAPSQGIRPAVTTDDEGPANTASRKSSGARSEGSGGGHYEEDDDESTMEEEDLTADEEARRKRMKVQHEENFEYI